MNLTDRLQFLRADQDTIDWVEAQKAEGRTCYQMWHRSDRPEWMIYLLGVLSDKPYSAYRNRLVACACDIASTAVPYVTPATLRDALELALKSLKANAQAKPHDLSYTSLHRPVLHHCTESTECAWESACYAYTLLQCDRTRDAGCVATFVVAAAGNSAPDPLAARMLICEVIRRHYPRPPVIPRE